ncbi:hybrid sensor histidine kinase/response regulator [Azospirillum sp. SYSU D00513]|uniref:hybrid sensor histidine kinase/response regulator n=1 Tax=Azospirillum sp. SYSU D00513 TaxID=2812561 RepID=UPI0020004A37|nr:hybrid sensor histidine kinase/response regulator [Azospirillum sp. SYSU D00513]
MTIGPSAARPEHGFLAGGGELGGLIERFDWGSTPLGPIGGWPQTVRTTVGLILRSPVPIVTLWGEEGVMIYNDAYSGFAGGRHPRLLGSKVREGWPEVADFNDHVMKIGLAGGTLSYQDQELTLHRHGVPEQVWMNLDYSPVLDEQGAPIGVIAIVVETTGKVCAEQAVRASEAQFRTMAQAMPVQVWTATPAGEIDWFNERVPGYIGDAAADIGGRDGWKAVVHPDDLSTAAARWEAALSSGSVYEAEFRIRRADGAWRWHLVRAVAVRDAAGAILRWVGSSTDIEDQTSAVRALAELNESLGRQITERTADRDRMWRLSTDFMLVHRLDGTITAINPAWGAVLGWSEADVLGRPCYELVHPEDRDATIAELGQQSEGRITRRFEVRVRDREGGYRWVSWTSVPDGGLVHAVGRDVTVEKEREEALRQAEEQLRQAQKLEAVGQLTGGVAHDFNNLLQALGGCLTMIGRRTDEPKVKPLLEAGQQAVDRGAKLVQQLMAFARREGLRSETIDLRDRLLGMSGLLERALRADIRLTTRFGPGLWPVELDPTQFELALINLAVNARDAMPDGGRLAISAVNVTLEPGDPSGLEGEFVQLSIADNGTGMPAEVRARAFDPFFTTKEVGKGSGLGLAQVYGLARQAGGTAIIDSEEGQGTTITLLLRRSAEAPPRAAEAKGAAIPAVARGSGRVLLVEDDPVVSSTVAAALEDSGYEVARVATADEALPLLMSRARIDLLFSDVVMPGRLNGVDLAREAARLRPGLPVVLATGYSETVARAEGVRILAKPYRIDELLHVLDVALAGTVRAAGGA